MTMRLQKSKPFALIASIVGFSYSALNAQILIEYRITVQPIRISNGFQTANPNIAFFEAETDKIWSQAGIDVAFLAPVTYTSAEFFNINSGSGTGSLTKLRTTANAGQNADPSVINMWFVNLIDGSASNLGFSAQSSAFGGGVTVTENGIAIANSTFTVNSGNGARDTLAHELGHNLGLRHATHGASGQLNLMSSTTFPPNGLADITPDGGKYGQLTPAQIEQARSVSDFVIPVTPYYIVPEPAFTSVAIAGLLGIGFLVRQRLLKR